MDNLLKRKKEWLFKFVTDPEGEPTNNRAERALRPSVMYRKSSIMAEGPPEIKKWMVKKRLKKMEEKLNVSEKTTDQTS